MFREKTEYLVCPIRLMDIYAEVKLVGGGQRLTHRRKIVADVIVWNCISFLTYDRAQF